MQGIRHLFVFLFFTLSAQISFGQSSALSVSIQFLDHHDLSPLPSASFTPEALDTFVVANNEGKIHLNLPDSLKTIRGLVRYGCCLNNHIEFDIHSDTSIILLLESHSEWMEDITVHSEEHHNHANVYIASAKLIESADASFAQLTKHIPGITMISHGGQIAKPMIHGLYGHRLQIVNHGILHRDQDWGIEHAPDISPWAGSQVEIYTRSPAVRFGTSAMGGAYVISTPMPSSDEGHWHGSVVNSLYFNGLGAGIHGRISGALAQDVMLTYSGSIQGQGDQFSPDYVLTNTGMRQHVQRINLHSQWKAWQHEAHVSYYARNTGILRSAHIGNVTDLNEALNRETPFYTEDSPGFTINNPRQATQHYTVGSNSQIDLNANTHLHIAAGYQQNERQEFDIRRGNRDSIPVVDLKLRTSHVEVSMDHNTSSLYTTVGLRYSHEENRPQSGTGTNPIIPFANTNTTAIFGTLEKEFGGVTLFSGLRYEHVKRAVKYYTGLGDYVEQNESPDLFAANLGLAWKGYRIDFSGIKRMANLYEQYADGIHPAAAVIIRGDSAIRSEQVWQANISLPFPTTNGWEIYAGLYYNYFPNFIYTISSPSPELTIAGAFFVEQYIQNKAQLGGLDLTIKKSIEKAHINLLMTSSITLGQNLDTKQSLPDIPPFEINPGLSWTTELKRNKTLGLSIDYQYLAKAWFYPIDQVVAPPPSAAHLVNASAELMIRTKKFFSMKIIAKCQNLTNHRYRTYLNRWRFYANEVGIQPTLKILSFF